MKRIRTSETSSAKWGSREGLNNNETGKVSKVSEQHGVVQNLQYQKVDSMSEPQIEGVKTPDLKQKNKLNLKTLADRNRKANEVLKPNIPPPKNKVRAVVDIKMMEAELKQLEDPPTTPWEKEICFNRLPYSFFDTPCEELAKNLLGKILVRCLENGTVLKGRIVETEGYLGTIDKASHTYQNKVTPRNIPMYMQPGTIYVYMTYGMYYCFNISSQESEGYVLVKAVEPILGLDYMELLRNMKYETGRKEKRIAKNVQYFKKYELCNSPSNVCVAFVIDEDSFNRKKIYECKNLWLEYDPYVKSTTIVAAHSHNDFKQKIYRYYVLGSTSKSGKILGEGCAVLVRAVEPLQGIEYMINQRTLRGTSNTSKQVVKNLKTHELCNGPSKLCMAFELHKGHSKYSLCTWKGLWIENDDDMDNIKIVECRRIGIDNYGEEWTNKPLRYYVHGNKAVSKRNKDAELLLGLH